MLAQHDGILYFSIPRVPAGMLNSSNSKFEKAE
jgi:hypothetical protein